MYDAKQSLVWALMCGLATFCPGMGSRQCLLIVAPIERVRTFVQGHDDIGAQFFLGVHDRLRRESLQATVDVRAKGDAVRIDLAHVGQAKDLVAARIGQDRPIPVHELVQPAHALHEVGARAQKEVIGIGQDKPSTKLL